LYVAILLGVGLMVLLVVGVALRQRKDYHTHDGFIQVIILVLAPKSICSKLEGF
jgi:hypothetical protein